MDCIFTLPPVNVWNGNLNGYRFNYVCKRNNRGNKELIWNGLQDIRKTIIPGGRIGE